jgi:hypothetical protein
VTTVDESAAEGGAKRDRARWGGGAAEEARS